MHFIQNSWFVVYSVWLLCLMLGVVGVILYIQNRTQLVKKFAFTVAIFVLVATCISLNTASSLQFSSKAYSLEKLKQTEENNVKSPSILNNVVVFIGTLLKEKLAN